LQAREGSFCRSGVPVLVVEDDFLIAADFKQLIESVGGSRPLQPK
jgi:GR25 family glycosyltransferase involved in LPS biosynthesis